MANIACPLTYLTKREQGLLPKIRSTLFSSRLNVAKNLYRRDLVCHFGCVNAIEFSNNGELLISGGDDRRVMVWQFGKALLDQGHPEPLKAQHQSNIFCLGITSDNKRIYSGGNDDIVLVHDLENKCPVEVLTHQRAVCGLSIDPFNERVVATAGNDGRLLLFDTRSSVHESLVISRSRKAFHAVMFHPQQASMVASANARDGVSLWDLRSPKHPVIRYSGSRNNSACQNSMSVRFNATGSLVLALRRRQPPVLYSVLCAEPVAEFYHQDYYNSCTMKSCSFAGEGDSYVLSGSDDFNLYMWRVPDVPVGSNELVVEPPHIVLYGHRSIVNQVRYNPQYCLIASSGVEKIIKVWSAMEYPGMRGALLEESRGSDNPREMYSHEDYVSLVHHSGQYISHNYVEQSTHEDPRMMAFFDSLVQRELECLAEESDSLDGSSSGSENSNANDSSDSEQIVVDFLPLPPKRVSQQVTRSQRFPNRLARLVASRYPKPGRSHRRGLLRRAAGRATRAALPPAAPRAGRPRRLAPPRPAPRPARRAAVPRSSERTSSEDCDRYSERTMIIMPSRRRVNLTRAGKRKNKCSIYRKPTHRGNGSIMIRDVGDIPSFNNFEENIALPSTSSGYRGQSSALFRIAEVDSDDDHSASSRPISPHNNSTTTNNIPNNLVGVVPTPLNGSRDPLESDSNSTLPDTRLRRRSRRTNRPSIHRSDSSESPPHPDPQRSTTPLHDRLARTSVTPPPRPAPTYNRTVARLMNETNESELESSCSTEGSLWPATEAHTPDSGVGSAPRPAAHPADVSDDPDYQAIVFRQRVKKARRNYRNRMDSDSNNSN